MRKISEPIHISDNFQSLQVYLDSLLSLSVLRELYAFLFKSEINRMYLVISVRYDDFICLDFKSNVLN